jgi:hypothetical protein
MEVFVNATVLIIKTTMENPQDEIAAIIPLLVATESPDTQKEAVLKYFDEDASFIHPLCRVDSGPNSRNDILAIYQLVLPRLLQYI